MKKIILILCIMVLFSPQGILTSDEVWEPSAPYKLLSYSASRQQIKYAVEAEFGASMVRVVECESKFNLKARNLNTNGSIDRGLFQINSVHIPMAMRLGINLDTIQGQFEYAKLLFKKSGMKPWVCARKLGII